MRLFLIRHGSAEAVSDLYTEESRPLTDQGVAEVEMTAECLASLALGCSSVWASPYARARQTADVIVRRLVDCSVTIHSFLRPDDDPSRAADAILDRLGSQELACIVGHQPHLGRLVMKLCHIPDKNLNLSPGCVVEIHIGPAKPGSRALCRQLCGLIHVRHLQAMPGRGGLSNHVRPSL